MKISTRSLATTANLVFKTSEAPRYILGSLRSFPSLEPHEFIPLPTSFFDENLRRDILWSAVVYEADRSRVGSNYVITRGDQPYSHKKLHPQKGTGRARVGDHNSPIRFNEVKAHGIKAPHDWSTSLPQKVYNKAFQNAFAEQYRKGRLFIVGGTQKGKDDNDQVDFSHAHLEATKDFVKGHQLESLNLLFITSDQRDNLLKSTDAIGKKADVLIKEAVEVRDILKANRIYIELPALQWFISRYSTV